MNSEFIKKLQCPYTGTELQVVEADNDLQWGVVATAAGEFPILDGILRLHYDELRPMIVEALRGGDRHRALELALDWPCRTSITTAIDLASRATIKSGIPILSAPIDMLKRRLYQKLSQPQKSFCHLLDTLPVPAYWREWQKYRFSMATFLSVYPLASVLGARGPVLDFACGLGHASYLLARSVGEKNTISADYSFSSLYIAKHYFVPEGNFVCLDGNGLLPFKSGTLAAVLCSDAFHFITQKLALAREFMRIVGSEGKVLLGHIHNKFSPLKSGAALEPESYGKLFADMHVRVIPEQPLIDGFFGNDTVDLDRSWSTESLNSSVDGVSLVASADSGVFREYRGSFGLSLEFVRNPILNPIYRVVRNDREVLLQKEVSPSYRKRVEMRTGSRVLPDYRVDAACLREQSNTALRGEDRSSLGNLLRDLIAIDVPRRYVGEL